MNPIAEQNVTLNVTLDVTPDVTILGQNVTLDVTPVSDISDLNSLTWEELKNVFESEPVEPFLAFEPSEPLEPWPQAEGDLGFGISAIPEILEGKAQTLNAHTS